MTALWNSYFSEGHIGHGFGEDDVREYVNVNDWVEKQMNPFEILKRNRWRDITGWLKNEEAEYGSTFDFYNDPIIVGPDPDGENDPWDRIAMQGVTVLDGWHRLAFTVRAKKPSIRVWLGTPKQKPKPTEIQQTSMARRYDVLFVGRSGSQYEGQEKVCTINYDQSIERQSIYTVAMNRYHLRFEDWDGLKYWVA